MAQSPQIGAGGRIPQGSQSLGVLAMLRTRSGYGGKGRARREHESEETTPGAVEFDRAAAAGSVV